MVFSFFGVAAANGNQVRQFTVTFPIDSKQYKTQSIVEFEFIADNQF